MNRTRLETCLAVALLIYGMIASTVAAEEMKPINIELPEPFWGCSLFYGAIPPNFEPRNYNKRPAFLAPKSAAIISRGKPVTASAAPTVGKLSHIVDGDKEYKELTENNVVQLPKGKQWVQIDLEQSSVLFAVVIWHFHGGDNRIYFDFVVQVANDPEFKSDVTTLYNNDYANSLGLGAGGDKTYIDDHKGRLIDAKGTEGRYLRIYGNGNSRNEFTHFVEVEVWGKKIE